MRRKEKQILEKRQIENIIGNATVCRLGMSDGQQPYIVPVCFGYQDNVIYIHSASEGRKIDLIRQNRNVCVEFDIHASVIEGPSACSWGMAYQSVIGFGQASFIEDTVEKQAALNIIMQQYSDQQFHFDAGVVEKTAVIKIDVTRMTAKQSGSGSEMP